MENINNNQQQPKNDPKATATNQIPTTGSDIAKDAVSADIAQVKSLIQKLKEGIAQKRAMAKIAKEQNLTGTSTAKPKVSLFKGNKKLMLAVLVFVVLIVLLIAASLYKALSMPRKQTLVLPTATPEILVSPTPNVVNNPSKYATDSAILEMEKMIGELDRNISQTEIRESQLTPPVLDFDVNLK